MGHEVAAQEPLAREVFAESDAALGMSLSQLCFEGPAEQLELTEYAQPAILTTSVALWRVLVARTGLEPLAVAGHSLGEWTALVAAGALSLSDAVRTVRVRGRLMQAAVPVGEGAMAAVLGSDVATVTALCEAAAEGQVLRPANLNGGGQVVVAGHTAAVDRLIAAAKSQRVRAQKLAVSAPFHCPLMVPAAAGLRDALAGVRFDEPRYPVISSVVARPVRRAAELPSLLVEQVTAPVLWEDTVRALAATGPGLAFEVGPGQALRGLLKRIVPDLSVLGVSDLAGLAAAAAAIE
jgi:[acyl-carrier-protein] S-malonyltransferase